jgi:ppGpp synthetase/RelA/SpoT-type nucleotidyltranferase
MGKTPEEWGKSYEEQIEKYHKFEERLVSLIRDLIEENHIEIAQIISRTKGKDSFTEKIKRKSYENPFKQCTDLVGIRIIVFHLDDLSEISSIIENEFLIDHENSIDKSKLLDPDRFGYLSIHYVASLSDPRFTQTEWKLYSELKFEIQIRTILQHAWSEIDHKLRYKKEDEVPRELKR